jgi:hypothetical protein
MKHPQAQIISGFLKQSGDPNLEGLPHSINSMPDQPRLILGISNDPGSSVRASRDSRTGKITEFHGVRLMLRAPSQSLASLQGNRLMQYIDRLPKEMEDKLVELADPQSTEENPLPSTIYTVVNLSRVTGCGIDRVPQTQDWVFTFTCRATITE